MKFRFAAVDQGGRVFRGVLRADSEEHARELFLLEDCVAKQLEPASEDERATWASKRAVVARAASAPAAAGEAAILSDRFAAVAVSGFPDRDSGEAGLGAGGEFVFRGAAFSATIRPEEVERIQLCGFPVRLLEFTLLSGKTMAFRAGILISHASARAIVVKFLSRKG